MDCTTITILKRRSRHGMTLVEMLVAAGVSSLVFVVGVVMTSYSGRSCAALTNYAEMDSYSRLALDRMTKEIREANRLTGYSATNLNFEIIDPGTGFTNTLTYEYDLEGNTLAQKYRGRTTVLLKNISPGSLQFSLFQRNPVRGAVAPFSTTNMVDCKGVQVSWTCARNVLGKVANTENVQSARIVMRKP